MQTDKQTKDAFRQQVHPELLAVLASRSLRKDELRVDSWQPSLIGRFVGIFGGKRARR